VDKVIVTALLIIGSVAAAAVVMTTILPSVSSGSQSVIETQQGSAGRLRTSIEVIAATSNVTGTTVDAWAKNVGLDPVYPVSKADVFVITPGSRVDAMAYSASGGDNTWVEDPVGARWDRADTLHIRVTLPVSDPLAVGDHVIRVTTANGVSSDKTFSR
jgi:hypothetical protein